MHDIHADDKKNLEQMLDGKPIPSHVEKRYWEIKRFYDKRSNGQPLGLPICALILADVIGDPNNPNKPSLGNVDISDLKAGDPVLFSWKNSRPRDGKFSKWLDVDRVEVEEEDGTLRNVDRRFVTLPETVGV